MIKKFGHLKQANRRNIYQVNSDIIVGVPRMHTLHVCLFVRLSFCLFFGSTGLYKGPALLVYKVRVSSSSISLVVCSLKNYVSFPTIFSLRVVSSCWDKMKKFNI